MRERNAAWCSAALSANEPVVNAAGDTVVKSLMAVLAAKAGRGEAAA
jgi:hypothetical protein